MLIAGDLTSAFSWLPQSLMITQIASRNVIPEVSWHLVFYTVFFFFFQLTCNWLKILVSDVPVVIWYFIHYKMITKSSYHTKLWQYYWLCSLCCTLYPHDIKFRTGSLSLLISTPITLISPPFPLLVTTSLFSVSMSLFIFLYLFFGFYM